MKWITLRVNDVRFLAEELRSDALLGRLSQELCECLAIGREHEIVRDA